MSKKENQIYELFNDIDLEDEIRDFEDISEFEKEKIKRGLRSSEMTKDKKNKNRLNKGVMIAGLVLMIGVGSQTSFGKEVVDLAKSKINDISYSISSYLNTNEDLEDYASVIDKVVEDKNIKIKLSEVIIDNDEMIVTSIIETEEDNIESMDFDSTLYINGKKINVSSSTGTFGVFEGEKNIFKDVKVLNIGKVDLDDDVEVEYKINKIYKFINDGDKVKNEKIKGNWSYAFKANTSELKRDTETIKIGQKIDFKEQEIILDELILNPVNQEIRGSIIKAKGLNYDMELRGYDDLGNEIKFHLSRADGKSFVFKYVDYEKPFDMNAKEIELHVYAVEFPEESGRLNSNFEKLEDKVVIKLK